MNIADVAKLAGVSTTTVSRVINNDPNVKELNRIRVEEAMRKLKYKPNVSAQRLAGLKTNAVGLILPPFRDMFGSFFISEILRGIGDALSGEGRDLLLHLSRPAEDISRDNILNKTFVAGVLFADIDGNEKLLEYAKEEGLPFVVINNYIEDESISCAAVDNRSAAAEVVDYLYKMGHRNIAAITGSLKTQAGLLRLEGYKDSLKKNGLEINREYIAPGEFTAKSASDAAKKLIEAKPLPSAIFVASDEMAQEVIRVFREAGADVPNDISIVGFDDNILAQEGAVPLTTMHQPLYEIARESALALSQIISGKKEPPFRLLLKARLVERNSVKRIANNK
ncbi:MAG: LacI family DNA-binding transcriptional regulator [Candidatus Omnitrophica bacterium]|nr:LacI family DNA-binding transcriptional regulator [Candidatus Omnitrophota bacterium]